jgi:xanthine/uracil permease
MAPKAAMTIKVARIVIEIATTLLILILTRKFTTGWSTTAIIIAKTIGTIIPLAMNNIPTRAIIPMKKTDALR